MRVRSRDRWTGVSLITILITCPAVPAGNRTPPDRFGKLTLGLLPAVLADQLNNILHDSRAKP